MVIKVTSKEYEVTVRVSYDDGYSREKAMTLDVDYSDKFTASGDAGAIMIAKGILTSWSCQIGEYCRQVGPVARRIMGVKLLRLCEITYREICLEADGHHI